MPCVCLSNTFRKWQALSAYGLQPRVTQAPKVPANTPTNVLNVEPIRFEDLKPGSTRADLINAESRLGSAIFGPIPAGHRREFFHDRQNIWIWHEDWQDQAEQSHQMTVRYEVRTSGVYKKVAAGKYLRLEGDELENFRQATHAYLYMVKKYLYKTPATTGAQA